MEKGEGRGGRGEGRETKTEAETEGATARQTENQWGIFNIGPGDFRQGAPGGHFDKAADLGFLQFGRFLLSLIPASAASVVPESLFASRHAYVTATLWMQCRLNQEYDSSLGSR